jgi:phosphoenolpyruvate carboxylase
MKANWGILLLLVGTGCGVGRGGLGVEAKAVTTQKPGLVAAYLSVTEDDGPAVGLRAADFTVYEDGLALSHDATRQVLLERRAPR